MTQVVLVDKDDKILGFKEKLETHKIPVPLHRAISIVIFNQDKTKMLVTQRAKFKPTWPLLWSNAVCSHPYPNETYQQAANRRIFEEVGFKTKLKEVFRFTYAAEMDNKIWGEHEYDIVFTGTYDGEVNPNPEEVADYEWIGVSELVRDITKHPKKYTPWFKIILEKMSLLKQ